MYHKLGRPKRTVQAKFICIKEPDSEPIYFEIANKGNTVNKISEMNILKNYDENKEIKSDINEIDQSFQSELNCKDNEDECLKLTDINYLLNKKPFPSLINFEMDQFFCSNQLILAI